MTPVSGHHLSPEDFDAWLAGVARAGRAGTPGRLPRLPRARRDRAGGRRAGRGAPADEPHARLCRSGHGARNHSQRGARADARPAPPSGLRHQALAGHCRQPPCPRTRSPACTSPTLWGRRTWAGLPEANSERLADSYSAPPGSMMPPPKSRRRVSSAELMMFLPQENSRYPNWFLLVVMFGGHLLAAAVREGRAARVSGTVLAGVGRRKAMSTEARLTAALMSRAMW